MKAKNIKPIRPWESPKSWGWTGLFILMALVFIVASTLPSMVWGDPVPVQVVKGENKLQSICPKTLMDSQCMTCHAQDWTLKEFNPDSKREYPIGNMKVRNGVGYLFVEEISAGNVWQFFDYLKRHDIVEAIIEITSPGGSLWDAGIIISYFDDFQGVIQTNVRGFAASAACLIFLGGDIRQVGPLAFLMWHELWTFKFLSVDTPTSSEDEANILRYLQSTVNKWFAERTKLQKEEIDERVKRKEFWLNAEDALLLGFADGYIR